MQLFPKNEKKVGNCGTCSWETLTMLNPQFVAGEHGLFGGHESKDIQTIFLRENEFPVEMCLSQLITEIKSISLYYHSTTSLLAGHGNNFRP